MNSELARAVNAHIRHTTAAAFPPPLSRPVRQRAGFVSLAITVFILSVVTLACMVAK